MSKDSWAMPHPGFAGLGMRVFYRVMRHPLWVTKDGDYAEQSLMEWGEMNGGHEWYLSALGAINGFLPSLFEKKLAFYQDDDGNLKLTTIPAKGIL